MKTITSPSGREYQWNKETPPTEADYAELQKYDASLSNSSVGSNEIESVPISRNLSGGPDAQFRAYQEPSILQRINDSDLRTQLIGPSTNTLLRQAQDRAYAGDEFRLQSPSERGALPSVLASVRQPLATTARILPAVLSVEGGPTGAALNAIGEASGQLIDPRARLSPDQILARNEEPVRPIFDQGEIAKSAAIGAAPLGSTAGILNTIKNAAKIGLGGVVGEEARSLINEGELSESALGEGGTMAAISSVVPLVAKALGVATNKIPKDVMERVAKEIRDNAETEASIAKITDLGGVINPASQNPSALNKVLGSIAGLQNIKNKSITINTPILDDIARMEARLSPFSTISEDTLKVARDKIMEPLNEIRGLGLAKEIDGWQAANQLRQDLLESRSSGLITPAEFRNGLIDAQTAMRSYEQTIDAAAKNAGRSELIGILPQVQEDLAKNFDVRRITPSGTGHINANLASGLAAQRVDAPGTLTGGLRDIANFNNAAYGAAGDVNSIAPHSGTLGPHAALGALALGNGPSAALSGGIMGMRGPIANLLLSPEYQSGTGVLGLLGSGARRQYPLAKNLSKEETQALIKAAAILSKDEAEEQ